MPEHLQCFTKAAGWSNARTCAMFYKKTINENFGEAILSAQVDYMWIIGLYIVKTSHS